MLKRKFMKAGACVLSAALIMGLYAGPAFAEWVESRTGILNYVQDGQNKTGWQLIEGKWYFFNEEGIMQTGWQNVNGNWYYLNSRGAMQTGWLLKEGKYYFLNTDGTMAYGWVNSQGSWYYFQKPDGDMLTNAYAPDGRYVNAEGVLIQ